MLNFNKTLNIIRGIYLYVNAAVILNNYSNRKKCAISLVVDACMHINKQI